jgi:hypothetical protein
MEKKDADAKPVQYSFLKNFLTNINRLDTFYTFLQMDYEKRHKGNIQLTKKLEKFYGGILKVKGRKDGIEISESEAELIRKIIKENTENYQQLLPFFRSQMLIFIVSLFEFYVKDAIEYMYSKNINSLKTKDKSIDYEKLLSFSNMDEILHYIVEKESFSIGFLSYDDLTNYLIKKWKINLNDTEILRESIEEIFQIRNILVHNRGKVNRTFLQKVTNATYKIDDSVEITDITLLNAVTLLTVQVRFLDLCVLKKYPLPENSA